MLREDRAAEAGTYAAAAARLPGKKKNCKKLIYFGKECTGFMKYGKRLTAWTLAGLLGISVFSQPLTVYAKEWSRVGNVYQMVDGTPIHGVLARGIDLSYWNQNVDWNQVAADDVKFAMLATRFRGAEDPFFSINARGASSVGIDIGAYIYSYATSVEMAEQEADFILNVIKDYPISYPVVFDAEDANTLGTLSPSEVSAVINAFCRKIEAAGYHPMVYANEHWIKNKIDMSALNYDMWVARYGVMYTYDSPAMWQATNTGSINGINGNVDINFLYKDFSSVIPANTWRTIGGSTYYYQNYTMQKSTWINDGQGQYYMSADGTPAKGWMTFPEGRYYLDASTGKMATDWQQLDGAWYFFDPSGTMATGWRDVNGARYYMDGEGRMQTGWQDIDGARYYLDGSGRMTTGWQNPDGASYYLGTDGKMQTGWAQVNGAWYYLNNEGKMQTGWQEIEGRRYFLDASGVMKTGWQDIDGSWYYFSASGAMKTGWQNLDGVWYYLNGEGKMQTGWQNVEGRQYYMDSAGVMQTGWQNINGSWYYLDSSGAMQTGWQDIGGARYYLNDSGVMLTDWQDIGGARYYFNSSGAMVSGWQDIGGARYYFDTANGALAVNTVLELDGVKYQAGADGVCTPITAETADAAQQTEQAQQTPSQQGPGH